MKRYLIAGAAVLLAGILIFASMNSRGLEPLPNEYKYDTAHSAWADMQKYGLEVIPVHGTGSMSPWISRYAPDEIVAYVGIDRTPFSAIKTGMVVRYQIPIENNGIGYYVHRVGYRVPGGFVMYGMSNVTSDHWILTEKNYRGRVLRLHTFEDDKGLNK